MAWWYYASAAGMKIVHYYAYTVGEVAQFAGHHLSAAFHWVF